MPWPYSLMHATEGALSRFAERGEIRGDTVTPTSAFGRFAFEYSLRTKAVARAAARCVPLS